MARSLPFAHTDYEHKFEKVKPRCGAECVQCGNPTGLSRVLDKLDTLEQKYAALVRKEQELLRRGGVSPALIAGGGAAAAGGRGGAGGGAAGDVFAAADLDGDGQISQAELAAYANQVQAHAKEQYDQYLAALKQANAETKVLRSQLQQLGVKPDVPAAVRDEKGSRGCAVM